MTQFWTNDCISGLTKMIHMQMQVGIATIRATPEICSKENSTGNSKAMPLTHQLDCHE